MTDKVLDDYRTAPISDKLRATLAFLEKMTLEPDALSPADAEACRAAGVSDRELEDAIYVCANFNVIDRIADTFEFTTRYTPAQWSSMGKGLLKRGYKGP